MAGTEGLVRYASNGDLMAAARVPDLDTAGDQLLALPRMKNGGYPDDVGFALVLMETPHSRTG